MKIGFIGVGVMGQSMVRHLMAAGHRVKVYTRTKAKAEQVILEGALWCETIPKCVCDAEVVITMVGYPKDVEEVYFGLEGIINSASKGTILIDMTTTQPKLSEKIYKIAGEKGMMALDAPVSGGDSGAAAGTLSIMVGGDQGVYERCLPIFEAMGKHIIYEGAAGKGQHTKMANQIAIAGAVSGVCEAIAYARASGLDTGKMLNSIKAGAAGSWQMEHLGPKMLEGDFDPGFYIKHYIKDMKIADEEAKVRDLQLEVLPTVLKMYQELAQAGFEDLGTQGLIRYYED